MSVSYNRVLSLRKPQPEIQAGQHAVERRREPEMDDFLRQEEEHYRQLIERCSDGIFLLRNGSIIGTNRAALKLLGVATHEELLGHQLAAVLKGPADARSLPLGDDQLTSDECPFSFERRMLTPEGVLVDAEFTVTPFLDTDTANGRLVVVRDLAARKSLSASLSQQDQYLRLITDTAPALIAYIDTEERYRFVNAAYEPWFGPRSGIVGNTVKEVAGTIYSKIGPNLRRALAGEHVSYEFTAHTPSGERHAMAVYTPDIDSDGTVRGLSSMVMDITERKNAEQVLRQHEQQLRVITDVLPLFIAQCDRDYRLHFVNRTYADRFAWRPEDAVGKRIPELIGEQAFARIRPRMEEALSGKPQEQDIALPMPDGKTVHMHLMYAPERDEQGRVRGLIAAARDISRLREAEERLQRREREFKMLVENSPDIISRIDRDMRHLYVNPAIEKLTGLKASAYIGKTKAELGLPPSVVQAWDTAAHTAFEQGVEQRLDFDYVVDGEMRYFSGRVVPEPDSDGHIESVVGVAYDVTSRAKMEKERDELLARERTARIQAETAARARDEFLAIVSHELRAPLNGIQSWAHVLENYVKEASSAPLAQRALKGIKTGVGQQVRLIEDLLDVTRMMSGKLRLVRQPLALLPTLQAAVEGVRTAAANKRIAITCTYRITSEQIDGDADRVQQIFWNLLSNAIKFTAEGGNVWLDATHTEKEICVTVRDDGVGISPEFIPHLFNRFSQEDTTTTRDHNGLGLGLFLVRHLVELHGGRATAHSEGQGKGTTFTVHFPLRQHAEKYAALRPDGESDGLSLPSLEGLHILLVDDQAEARESLTVVLTAAGAEIFAAGSAAEALNWLPTLSEEEFPDVLVCDIAMPGEDGYAVLRKLRAWKSASGTTPLKRMPALALTAFAQREDRIRALTAGFQMHVTKPVAPEELIVVIDTMVSHR